MSPADRTAPPAAPAPPLSDRADAPDADFAAALRVDPGALGAPPPAPTPEEARVAEAVLAHFAVARPGPSSFPSIATQILELVRYPDLDLAELARYIKVDGALAGGVLSLANSAVYRGVRTIDTVKDAVARLGVSEVARLAAAISMRALYSADASAEFKRFTAEWERLFLHAATTARAASELARRRVVATPGAEQTFMAGLLHDVGLSIALRSYAALSVAGKIPALEAASVAKVLHRVHVQVGVEMHRVWRLPASLADVAAHHHDAAVAPGAEQGVLHLVRLVSALDLAAREPGAHPGGAAEALQSSRALGLSPAKLAALSADLEAAEAWVRTAFPPPGAAPAALPR